MATPTIANSALNMENTIIETKNIIIDDVELLVKNNFDEIKKLIGETLYRLDDSPLALDIITVLMETVELNNKRWNLNGLQKEQLVIIFCKLLADEFKEHPSKELNTLSILLSNEEEIQHNIALIFKISEGVFNIQNSRNPEDGLEDEIKTVKNCCIPILMTLFNNPRRKKKL
jgi:hypothetical protein